MKRLLALLAFGAVAVAGAAASAADLSMDAFSRARWMVRDVAANSDWTSQADAPSKLNLKLQPAQAPESTWNSKCIVIDTSGKDRAVTLALVVPLDAGGATWWDDPQTSRRIEGDAAFSNLSDRAGGMDDSASLYPFSVISGAGKAICLGVPLQPARLPRLVYLPREKQLRAEFDFGLSPIPTNFKSRADAAVVAFEVPAKWAFRQAIAKYWAQFPNAFARRDHTPGGLWMPFAETGPIEDAKDFGFAYHEVADQQVRSDDRVLKDDQRIGCGSYIYVEPQTYWQLYNGKGKGTYDERLAQLKAEAHNGVGIAQGTIVSGVIRDTGKLDLYMPGVAYTKQLPWGSSPEPAIVDPDQQRNWPSKARYEFDRLEPLLGLRDQPSRGLEGVYVDSMEGWAELLDYSHDHWRVASAPLTFDPKTKKVALLNFWGTYAWVKQMASRLHAKDMILFGNDAYFRRWQLAPFVDVPGREYTWIENGKIKPVEDEHYLFFRTMSGQRPYLMLMNNRFEDASIMEPYFQRSVFYAVYPSMFQGHASEHDVSYFENPAWYNRDRPLFKKYVPMVRKLDQAGWQPVPNATVEPKEIRIERWGDFRRNNLAFTIHNPTGSAQRVTLSLFRGDLQLPQHIRASEWIRGDEVKSEAEGNTLKTTLTLPAGGYAVLAITR
jgi:hypothetical protein